MNPIHVRDDPAVTHRPAARPLVPGDRVAGGGTSPRAVRAIRDPHQVRRLLFLDDDPRRAEIFLKDNPDAVWVNTVAECLARLAEPWDEVHLDHDLGGKMFVDSKDTDCGMEVIRWLCKEPRNT